MDVFISWIQLLSAGMLKRAWDINFHGFKLFSGPLILLHVVLICFYFEKYFLWTLDLLVLIIFSLCGIFDALGSLPWMQSDGKKKPICPILFEVCFTFIHFIQNKIHRKKLQYVISIKNWIRNSIYLMSAGWNILLNIEYMRLVNTELWISMCNATEQMLSIRLGHWDSSHTHRTHIFFGEMRTQICFTFMSRRCDLCATANGAAAKYIIIIIIICLGSLFRLSVFVRSINYSVAIHRQ